MKFIYIIPLAFIALTAWMIWLDSSYWGWSFAAAFFSIPTITTSSSSSVTEDETNLIKKIRDEFKKDEKN